MYVEEATELLLSLLGPSEQISVVARVIVGPLWPGLLPFLGSDMLFSRLGMLCVTTSRIALALDDGWVRPVLGRVWQCAHGELDRAPAWRWTRRKVARLRWPDGNRTTVRFLCDRSLYRALMEAAGAQLP
jgi:hypothetical protein